MAIPDDKARLIITLPDKLKSNFELLCELDKRTASKQFEYILEYYINNVETRLSPENYTDFYNQIYLPQRLVEKIYYFLSRKTGQYQGKNISVEYFYEIFKDEKIDDKIIKDILLYLNKSNIPMENFFLKCIDYYNSKKD
jgi:hypothetical protein